LRRQGPDIINHSNRVGEKAKPLKLAAVSLGCSKNRIDTEEVLGYLAAQGCILTDDYQSADLIFINTCGFIADAQQESVNTILEMIESTSSTRPRIVAAGCLVEVFGEKILESIPELDGAIGVHSYRELDRFMRALFSGERPVVINKPGRVYHTLSPRILTTPAHSAFVRIADGCDNRCHYCMIPAIRGPYRSRPAGEIVGEISDLLDRGAAEINLVAQDTTAYGSDFANGTGLADLLEEILELDRDFRIRIMYTYPSRIDDRLIKLIRDENRICKYLDIPVQHSSDRILQLMGRHYRRDDLEKVIYKLRRMIPELALRTTVMLGYPGETNRDFLELLNFIEKQPFESLGAFTYSRQAGTPAADLDGRVPARVGKKRLKELMLHQKQISRRVNQKYIGQRLPVLVEGRASKKQGWYYGRSEHQAPEVDGLTYFFSRTNLRPGDWVSVKIKAAGPYNLLAGMPVPIDRLPR